MNRSIRITLSHMSLALAATASLATQEVTLPWRESVDPVVFNLAVGQEARQFLFETHVGGGPVRKGTELEATGWIQFGVRLVDDHATKGRTVRVLFSDDLVAELAFEDGTTTDWHFGDVRPLEDGDIVAIEVDPGPALDLRVMVSAWVGGGVGDPSEHPKFEPEFGLTLLD